MGSKGNTVMLDEFRALLEKSLTNKTDRYWLDQVGLEINDENDLCIVVSSDFIKSAIEKKVYSKIKSVYKLKYNNKADCVFVVDKNFQKTSVFERSSIETTVVEKKQDDIVAETRYDLSFFDELFVGSCMIKRLIKKKKTKKKTRNSSKNLYKKILVKTAKKEGESNG